MHDIQHTRKHSVNALHKRTYILLIGQHKNLMKINLDQIIDTSHNYFNEGAKI